MAFTEGTRFRIALIGDPAVGKSSLVSQFLEGKVRQAHDVTIMELYRADMVIEGVSCQVHIVDTAGQEEYDQLREHVYPVIDAFLMVVAMDNVTTFMHVGHHLNMVQRFMDEHAKPRCPLIVLAANKDDVDPAAMQFGDDDLTATVEAYAPFIYQEAFRTSAKTGRGVKLAFERTVKQALMNRTLIEQKRRQNEDDQQRLQQSSSANIPHFSPRNAMAKLVRPNSLARLRVSTLPANSAAAAATSPRIRRTLSDTHVSPRTKQATSAASLLSRQESDVVEQMPPDEVAQARVQRSHSAPPAPESSSLNTNTTTGPPATPILIEEGNSGSPENGHTVVSPHDQQQRHNKCAIM